MQAHIINLLLTRSPVDYTPPMDREVMEAAQEPVSKMDVIVQALLQPVVFSLMVTYPALIQHSVGCGLANCSQPTELMGKPPV